MQTSRTVPIGQPAAPLLQAASKHWWLVLLRGIAAIVFGVLAFVWPGATLLTLVVFFGAYALIDGVLALAAAAAGRGGSVPLWWLIISGILGIAAGVVTFVWPGMTTLILIVFIGAWSLARGVFEIIDAIRLRKQIENEWTLALMGALSVLFGLAVLIAPGAGALALIWVIGAYAVVLGILLVALAIRLKRRAGVTAASKA
jgi:uncharacterized membrane protein HdeD (DUF308 family)